MSLQSSVSLSQFKKQKSRGPMKIHKHSRHLSHAPQGLKDVPFPSINVTEPRDLLLRCPDAGTTSLHVLEGLGNAGQVFVKDERTRMGLGSFKALGAAYVIARASQSSDLSNMTYVTASAGNHGLSVAAGAQIFGTKAVIYLSHTVPESFAQKLRKYNAKVVRAGDNYEASMVAAQKAATEQNWVLLSDTSWDGYLDIPHRLMEGYLVMAAEAVAQVSQPPTHIFLQAGVGGLAAAAAAYFRHAWGNRPAIIVVEPEIAPAIFNSILAGKTKNTPGPVSNMGRLDCKKPSLIALKGLARDADMFALISDQAAQEALPILSNHGLETTPSGGAGLAALLSGFPNINENSRVLCILSEKSDT